MIYPVKIKSFDAARERISFEFRGASYTAAHVIAAREAQGLIEPGTTYPLEFMVECADVKTEYLASPERSFEKTENPIGVTDSVRAKGRVADYIGHNTIRLDGDISVAVKLAPPQLATDFRRGSWLVATGMLCVSLPHDEH